MRLGLVTFHCPLRMLFLKSCLRQVCDEVKASDPEQAAAISGVVAAVNAEASNRIAKATSVLQAVLAAGSPGQMETEMARQCRVGAVDEAVFSLLEANIAAATKAGATEPAAVMEKVTKAGTVEKAARTVSGSRQNQNAR